MSLLPEPGYTGGRSGSVTVSGEVVDDDRIDELARSIREGHARFARRGKELILEAIRIGEMVLEARTLVPRGQWGRWLRQNVQLAEATVYMYEHLAMGREQLEAAWDDGAMIATLGAAMKLVKPGSSYGQPRGPIGPGGHGADATVVEISDEMVAKAAMWFVQRFPRTFGKMAPATARRRSHEWAKSVLKTALSK